LTILPEQRYLIGGVFLLKLYFAKTLLNCGLCANHSSKDSAVKMSFCFMQNKVSVNFKRIEYLLDFPVLLKLYVSIHL